RSQSSRFVRLQARANETPRPGPEDGYTAGHLLRPGGSAPQERLGVSKAWSKRPLGVGPVSPHRWSRRRSDHHQVNGRRDCQPHAGAVFSEQWFWLQRLSFAGKLAVLWSGERG